VIEKNNHAITSNIQDYFCTFVLDSKSRKQFKFFFSPKLPPNLFLNSLFLPASFLVSNENQAKNQISKQTKLNHRSKGKQKQKQQNCKQKKIKENL